MASMQPPSFSGAFQTNRSVRFCIFRFRFDWRNILAIATYANMLQQFWTKRERRSRNSFLCPVLPYLGFQRLLPKLYEKKERPPSLSYYFDFVLLRNQFPRFLFFSSFVRLKLLHHINKHWLSLGRYCFLLDGTHHPVQTKKKLW